VIAESFGVDYMECASSFLISMCRSNLWAFHQDGLHEAAMLKTGPGGLALVIQGAINLGLLVRHSGPRGSVLRPGPRWLEIERALFPREPVRGRNTLPC
jgi:hypothetical protein